ncbi:MAG: DUF2083 domain-containing protein [Robiginitomaculum sp.]|nr:DUF2083 domain-containing protein [Robiginitomaculum sp.]
MAERKLFAGARLKRLRRDLKLTQARMAEELGVSPSYLNLMERNQRPITAQVLIRLVETYDLDLGIFSAEPDQQTFLALREAGSDPVLASLGLDDRDLKELNEAHPLGAQALVRLHRAYRHLSHTHAGLTERLSDEPFGQRPEEIVHDIHHENEGYFPEIEEAAELFCAEIRLNRDDLFRELTQRLQQLHSIRTRIMPESVLRLQQRRYEPHSRRLLLSELLSNDQRCFALAEQIAHLELRDLFDEKCMDERVIQAGAKAKQLVRAQLAKSFAMAVLLPYSQVYNQALEMKYDVQRLAARFGVGTSIMARRLASLRRAGMQGLPLFFLRLDRAGTVIERSGAKSFAFSRFGGTCPKWNIWHCFDSPTPKADFVTLDDGTGLMSIAFTNTRFDPSSPNLSYAQVVVLGCVAERASETVYGTQLGEARELHPTLIGSNCRTCERDECGQRTQTALQLGAVPTNSQAHTALLSTLWSGEI